MAPELVSAVCKNPTTKAASPSSRAFVTFLAGAGDYVKGVVGLAKGLKRAKSVYPLVVAVMADVPEEHRQLLRSHGCIVRDVEPVPLPQNDNQFARHDFAINYCKLRLWSWVEFSKMIYLDADTQVYINIDDLFDLPDGGFMYGVVDCLCDSPDYPVKCPEVIQWPAELGPRPEVYFNAGMFMFEPSLSTYDDILKTLAVTPVTPFAEQDFLNLFYKDKKVSLPHEYNTLIPMLWRHPEKIDLEKVRLVHFTAIGSKPWRYTGKDRWMDREDVKLLVDKWWDIYNQEDFETDDSNANANSNATDLLNKFNAALPDPPAVHSTAAPSAA